MRPPTRTAPATGGTGTPRATPPGPPGPTGPIPATASASAPARLQRARALRFGARLVLELLVVFIGVFAAFMLAERQRERVADERRQQFQLALAREIEDITRNTRAVALWIPGQMAEFDSLVAAGARPPLQPMTEPVRVQTHMWEATLQSGGLDLFDVPTVYGLSRFYNVLNAGFAQLEQLRLLSETQLIPRLGEGPDAFYDPATGRLRPQYEWYPQGMRRLGALAEQITLLGDSLVVELRAGAPAAPRSSPHPEDDG